MSPTLSLFDWLFKSELGTHLRPPGVQSEKDFLATCIKCGRCFEVCPYRSIKTADWGSVHYGTPYIEAGEKPCYLCMKCPKVCPTGALQPAVTKEKAGMGRVEIVHKTCLTWQGDLCNLCYKNCPLQETALVLDDELRPVIKDCVGCGVCLYVCPTKPKSIRLTPTGAIV